MNREVYERNADVRDESLDRILNAAVRIKKSEDQIGGKTRDLSHKSCEVHWGLKVGFSNIHFEL
jgi:hypothetical protein